MGRNLEAYSNAYTPRIGFTKPFTTLEAKAFIIKIIDESIKFLRRYEVNDKDSHKDYEKGYGGEPLGQ